MQIHWLDILPLLILNAGGLIIFCAGAFLPRRPAWLLFALAALATLAAGVAACLIMPAAADFLGMLDLGGYARFFTVLILAVTFLTLLFLQHYSQVRGFAHDELFALIIFAAVGMILTAAALDWLMFFLGLELLSLSLYVLIAIRRGQIEGQEAAVKYFIMGAVSSGFLTFGMALLYAATGTLNIKDSLAGLTQAASLPAYGLALALIFVGLGFKISIVPFHLWTPDVYEGAPAPVTAFLSAGSKVALFAALIRFALDLAPPAWDMVWPVLWVLAVLTMAAGNITAVYQTRVKRLLAYSSVAQMGYLLMTLVAVQAGEPAGPAVLPGGLRLDGPGGVRGAGGPVRASARPGRAQGFSGDRLHPPLAEPGAGVLPALPGGPAAGRGVSGEAYPVLGGAQGRLRHPGGHRHHHRNHFHLLLLQGHGLHVPVDPAP